MSSHLWKAYYEDDVDTFRQLLEGRSHTVKGGGAGGGFSIGSPGTLGTSPTLLTKARKPSGYGTPSKGNAQEATLSKADINWRDGNGLTILHQAVSSTAENAVAFASMLVEHPLIDLYLQDHENGWTALHRAFYFGNITLARAILERESGNALGKTIGHVSQSTALVKIKDREGHGPLDLYAATIKDRTLRPETVGRKRSGSESSDEAPMPADNEEERRRHARLDFTQIDGDEVYTFGSNRNVSLGFGDQDDRQFPERITLRRPEHLLRRFYREHLREHQSKWSVHDSAYESRVRLASSVPVDQIPWVVRTKPLLIQDVHMAKLHTAVLTEDPVSNLYICGHGQGGRLGVGDETTRYSFVCVEGGALSGKKIATVALGQNHTLAVSDDGEIFSWGNNGYGQLGYSLPKAGRDEDPISTTAQQIFGPLKREIVRGVAASRIHSVAFTDTSLYTFGKNEGQLGIVDSDARSLETQVTPRKVAASLFSSPIASATAIDKATVCLLENHDVWVFANYGYAKVAFPLEGFSNHFLKSSFLVTTYDAAPNKIIKVTSGGDTVCALSSRGEVFTLSINQRPANQSSSTTNPTKIRNAIGRPQVIWSLKKGNMAARDVGVDADGSIVLTTEEGSVWKRTKRAKIKDATASGTGDYRPKDYKFSRIPGLTRVLAVRASAHGAYAAVRRDCDVTKTQVVVEDPAIWKDLLPLSSLRQLAAAANVEDEDRHRFWQGNRKRDEVETLKKAIAESKDIEADVVELFDRCLKDDNAKYDAVLKTTTSDIAIPVHRFLLKGRSRTLRRGFRDMCETSTFTVPDLAVSDIDKDGRTVVNFQGLDILTLINLTLYLYTDNIVELWHNRSAQHLAYRYRNVRVELMKVAAKFELLRLEPAVRQMIAPRPCLDMDLEIAYQDHAFFFDGDVVVQLEDDEMRVHSVLVCARCPFFEGLFMGRAGGRWLADRSEDEISVDLSHINAKTFGLVLRHIYADTGPELFDEITSTDVDEFLDTVLDVLSVANELMLDRLSQICQALIGRYVNARNVCWLLNAVSPSSVHEFKHASLEYLCLNLEAMLQGHHLNELDEDILEELDEVVRQNQLACMPFAKSGRAELELHERHPELSALIDRNRQAKIDSVRLRTKFHDIESFASGSLDDDTTQSPMQQKTRRRSSQIVKTEGDRPSLKPKASTKDMMFTMDEEVGIEGRSPDQSPAMRPITTPRLEAIASSPPAEDQWFDARGKAVTSPILAPQQSSTPMAATPCTPKSPLVGAQTPPNSGAPWTITPQFGAKKTDLRGIMEQASSSRTSSLSQGIASAKAASTQAPSPLNLPAPKLSQKDRKKMQQQQLASQPSSSSRLNESQVKGGSNSSPWQTISAQKVPSLKDVIDTQKTGPPAKAPPTTRASTTPQLTMRQTVANPKPTPPQKPVIGPGSISPHQQRPLSENKSPAVRFNPSQRPRPMAMPSPQSSGNSKPIPQSIRHQPLPVEPSLQLSMEDILAQQQAEKDVIKEAVAKRDLQDIQAEQEFQEWWEKESKRVQEAETRGTGAPSKGHRRGRGGGKAGRGGRGGRERGRGGGASANANSA